nr:hypothetical protein [Tanacetum cinerariifolium]
TQKPRKPTRKDTQVPQSSGLTEFVTDEAVYKELGDILVWATTTASSVEAEQDSVDAAQVSIVATTITITTEEITLAQALEALKTLKPKVKGKEKMLKTKIRIFQVKTSSSGISILLTVATTFPGSENLYCQCEL